MTRTEEHIALIDAQMITVIVFIISLVLMIYLLNTKKENDINNHASNKETRDLALFNKILTICIYLVLLYISYTSYKKSNSSVDGLVTISSIIAVIPPIILVFAFILAKDDPTVMNPLL